MKILVYRILCLISLAFIGSLLTDYLLATPTFCGVQHGCDQVILSAYGRPLGVPLPVGGLIAFGLFLGLTFVPSAGRLLAPLALLAGFVGLGLFAVQWLLLEQFCPLCLVVDLIAMLLAMTELAITDRPSEAVKPPASAEGGPLPSRVLTTRSRPRRLLWSGAALVAVGAPLAWGVFRPQPPVPDAVRALWRDGAITVVEITDFECVYCRQNHPILDAFLEEHGPRLQYHKQVYPLPHHDHARPAARAYLAAGRQGKAEAMANLLFTADDLSPLGCERLAAGLRLDMTAYRACVADSATDLEIDRDTAWLKKTTVKGLPLIWIQDQNLIGLQTPESLHAALRRAERSSQALVDSKR